MQPGDVDRTYADVKRLKEMTRYNPSLSFEEGISKFMDEVIGDYIADILVENKVIIELKCVSSINSAHRAQIANYLKATGVKLGIIINFSKKSLEYERVVL